MTRTAHPFLPDQIVHGYVTIVGRDQTAFVQAADPWPACPVCHTVRAYFIVKAGSYACLLCSGD